MEFGSVICYFVLISSLDFVSSIVILALVNSIRYGIILVFSLFNFGGILCLICIFGLIRYRVIF